VVVETKIAGEAAGSFTSLALLTEVGQRPFFILSKVRTTE